MNIADALKTLSPEKLARQVAPEIHAYMHSRIIVQFREQGGRGVNWDPFMNPWYTRSDGTSVPITGGVPWKNNPKRKVKGKLRSKNPEGKKRYTANSKLMQSTGMLRSAILADMRISSTNIEMITPVKYAGYQNALRPWNYITQEELAMINSMIVRRLT